MSWLKPILFLIPTAVFAGGLAVAHVSPLTTHALHVPLNSTATAAPVTLAGITGLPALLWGHAGQQRWAILGGSLLQLGQQASHCSIAVSFGRKNDAADAEPTILIFDLAACAATFRQRKARATPTG